MSPRIPTAALALQLALLASPLTAAPAPEPRLEHLRDARGRLHLIERTEDGLEHRVWSHGAWQVTALHAGDVLEAQLFADAAAGMHVLFREADDSAILHGTWSARDGWSLGAAPALPGETRWMRAAMAPDGELLLLRAAAVDGAGLRVDLCAFADSAWGGAQLVFDGPGAALPAAETPLVAVVTEHGLEVRVFLRVGESLGSLVGFRSVEGRCQRETLPLPGSFHLEEAYVSHDGALHMWGRDGGVLQSHTRHPDGTWETAAWAHAATGQEEWAVRLGRDHTGALGAFDPEVLELMADLGPIIEGAGQVGNAVAAELDSRFGAAFLEIQPRVVYRWAYHGGSWHYVCIEVIESNLLDGTQDPISVEVERTVLLNRL